MNLFQSFCFLKRIVKSPFCPWDHLSWWTQWVGLDQLGLVRPTGSQSSPSSPLRLTLAPLFSRDAESPAPSPNYPSRLRRSPATRSVAFTSPFDGAPVGPRRSGFGGDASQPMVFASSCASTTRTTLKTEVMEAWKRRRKKSARGHQEETAHEARLLGRIIRRTKAGQSAPMRPSQFGPSPMYPSVCLNYPSFSGSLYIGSYLPLH
jgi:hypothetical protein